MLFDAADIPGCAEVRIRVGDIDVFYQLEILAPSHYIVSGLNSVYYDVPNEAGLFEMDFSLKVFPTNVSFYAVDVIELPCVATNAVGYYLQPSCADELDHGKRGAGFWREVGVSNDSSDIAQYGYCEKPWLDGGSFTWPIPNAWRVRGRHSQTNLFESADQRFELDSNGTARLNKFGYWGERTTNSDFRVWKEDVR